MIRSISYRRTFGVLILALVTAGLTPLAAAPVTATSSWIVTGQDTEKLGELVESLGGKVRLNLQIISGVAIDLPMTSVAILQNAPEVSGMTPDVGIELHGGAWESGRADDQGALANINHEVIGATRLWKQGVTGQGVDIALIDTGVSPVKGLGSNVIYGPDISFDAGLPNLANLDFYGHGTHLASIMSGNDGVASPGVADLKNSYLGVAPGSRVVSIKVANAIGLADVSQVIAGIDWVVQNRNSNGLNIRVLALAFGTDSTQDYRIDPLSMAVEQAWKQGVVVVTAAGNDGKPASLRNPAHDPYVIAVGAAETKGTKGTGDDQVLAFSNCGSPERPVDLVAPGRSVLGLRVPGSFIDANHPSAVVQDRLFRGTGTSQATAVVAGAAALLIDQRPELSPDQVKALLATGAQPQPRGANCEGAGLLDVAASSRLATPDVVQTWPSSDGSGFLEAARGSHHVALDGVTLEGEIDWLGGTWSGGTWSGGTWSGGTWSGGTWSGGTWSGGTWSGGTWSGGTWSGGTWSGGTWSGGTWSGGTWSGGTWSGGTWSGGTWSGDTWSAEDWD